MSASFAQRSEHLVRVNNSELFYQRTGRGEPLFLLHGWTQSSAFWDPYIPALSQHYEIFSIDLRGHGRSSPLNKEFSISLAAKDVLALADTLGLKDFKAIGLSYGGLVLLEICRMRNDALLGMVLIGTSYQYNGADAQKGKPAFRYDDLDAGFKAYLKEQHKHGEEQIRAMFDTSLNYNISLSVEDLKRIKAKTMIINGDADHIADLKQVVDMKKNIPHSMLWILPGTGHMALTDEIRDEFTKRVIAFF